MRRSRLDGKRFDVIICGGGSAGVAAAYGSAKAGRRTLLLERLGFCGGTPVAAGIHTLDAVYSCRETRVPVVAGFARHLVDELVAMGGMATADNPDEALSVHPELMKVAIDRLLLRAGVETIYNADVIGSLMDANTITGIEASLMDGRGCFAADVVIDATGDAFVAFMGGADCSIDRELQAITYHFRLGNVAPGPDWRDLENACRDAMERAVDADVRYGGPWVIRLADGEVSINATRVYGNPVDPVERTDAERSAREDMLRIAKLLCAGVPALRASYIITGATTLHVRESRKVAGDYVLTEDDIIVRRRFDDAIALGAWPVDIHPTDGFVGVHPHKENPPAPYEIPYRCLLPHGVEGLLISGRPISTTHRAHGSTRVPGTSMATGHAAGVAAALASRAAVSPRTLNVAAVRNTLIEQGGIVALAAEVTS